MVNTQIPMPFSMSQWGLPQQVQVPQVDLSGAGGSPFLPNMGDMGNGAYLPSGTTTGIYGPNMPTQPTGLGASLNSWLKDAGVTGTAQDPGWGGMAMGAAGGIFNAFMGMKQYGLAKDTLEQNKQQFAQNYAAQRSMTNSRMEDRQRARIGSSGGTNANYQSVGDYMNKNGVK